MVITWTIVPRKRVNLAKLPKGCLDYHTKITRAPQDSQRAYNREDWRLNAPKFKYFLLRRNLYQKIAIFVDI